MAGAELKEETDHCEVRAGGWSQNTRSPVGMERIPCVILQGMGRYCGFYGSDIIRLGFFKGEAE